MQEPDNLYFYCFEKNPVKVFNRASVNKVLTKYYKSIKPVFLAAHALNDFLVVCFNLGTFSLMTLFTFALWWGVQCGGSSCARAVHTVHIG